MTDEVEAVSDERATSGVGFRLSRRRFLQAAGVTAGAVALGGGIAEAATAAGHRPTNPGFVLPEGFSGTIADLKHVVILMKENRSFDQYFGQLPGVRGFNDKQVLKFQDGTTVFQQRDSSGAIHLPFQTTGEAGNDHSFYGANGGRWNTWVIDKGNNTMEFDAPQLLPWLWSLASQYTLCDQYFCAEHGPTIPNRLYLMSGTAGGTTDNGGQNLYNRAWLSVPEQLQAAGIDWRVYSDNSGNGLGGSIQGGWVGEYGCNVENCFSALDPRTASAADLAPGTGKVWRANSFLYGGETTPNDDSDANLDAVLATFIAACQPGAQFPLAQVSWVVMPQGWSEHPSADPMHGDRYSNRVLQALQSNPDIWNHTLLIINYDENDGTFDHVLPPRPEPGTTGEFSGSTPFGPGPRVPMVLVSPWTRGGWVASEVFDHTSTIRFLENWAAFLGKPFTCPNITPWRRSVVGDLTSAIDFAHPQLGPVTLVDPTTGPVPVVIADKMKPRGSAFHAHATLAEDRAGGTVTASMTLTGGADGKAVSLQVFPDNFMAFSNTPFTVTADAPRQYVWDVKQTDGKYAFSIYSNDGFVRSFAGQVLPAGQNDIGIPRVDVALVKGPDAKVSFTLHNDGTAPVRYSLAANDYLGGTQVFRVAGGGTTAVSWPTQEGYYDVVITADNGTGWTQRYAGRVATV